MSIALDLTGSLFALFVCAKLLGTLLEYCKLPSLIGELLAGILLGPQVLHVVSPQSFYATLSTLGAIILLFSVGLEVKIEQLQRVGRYALTAAVLGVFFPFALIAAAALGLHFSLFTSLFLATAGVATSVGITARILQEKDALESTSGRIILGAAILDDILGIAVLALISSYVKGGGLPLLDLALVLSQIVAFLVIAVWFLPRFLKVTEMARFNSSTTFILALVVMLSLSLLAEYVGLAAIVGAFFAGITFARSHSHKQIRKRLRPLYFLLVPFFFIVIGLKLDVRGLVAGHVLYAGLVITAVAIVGKLLGGVLATYKLGMREAFTVGVGMVPRGEVGLVVASIGYSLGTIGQQDVAIVVLLSFLTTLLVPPVLSGLLRRT